MDDNRIVELFSKCNNLLPNFNKGDSAGKEYIDRVPHVKFDLYCTGEEEEAQRKKMSFLLSDDSDKEAKEYNLVVEEDSYFHPSIQHLGISGKRLSFANDSLTKLFRNVISYIDLCITESRAKGEPFNILYYDGMKEKVKQLVIPELTEGAGEEETVKGKPVGSPWWEIVPLQVGDRIKISCQKDSSESEYFSFTNVVPFDADKISSFSYGEVFHVDTWGVSFRYWFRDGHQGSTHVTWLVISALWNNGIWKVEK